MCVYKNHEFICFLQPPSWSGTTMIWSYTKRQIERCRKWPMLKQTTIPLTRTQHKNYSFISHSWLDLTWTHKHFNVAGKISFELTRHLLAHTCLWFFISKPAVLPEVRLARLVREKVLVFLSSGHSFKILFLFY